MLNLNISDAVTYPKDVFMPEYGLYGTERPIDEWEKPKDEIKTGFVDVKTLAEQFDSMKNEIKKLNEKIEKLEKGNLTIPENTLIQFWDNEYDDQWNEC